VLVGLDHVLARVVFQLKHQAGYRKLRSGHYINYLSPKIISNEKSLNYKVVDLVGSYKFRIKFISILIHTK
jgi:hypothetical protein